jgi:enoyl-CoA hydratase/carnithine racemase
MSDPVRLQYDGRIANLIMDGDERNTIDDRFLDRFRSALQEVEKSEARVMIIRSAKEGYFSNGFNPDVFLGAPPEKIRASFKALLVMGAEQFFFPLPTISIVTGYAAGGGAFIAAYSDFRFMSMKKARIGFTEVNLAMTVPSSALEILSRKIGYQNVIQTVLTGNLFKAEDCLRYNLVDEIYEDDETTVKKAESLAKKIAGLPVSSLRSLKKNASTWIPRDHLEALMEKDLDEVEKLMVLPDCQNAFAALKSGRRPKFD